MAQDWIGFHDHLQHHIAHMQDYLFMAYLPFLSVAFHFLFAASSKTQLKYPNTSYEVTVCVCITSSFNPSGIHNVPLNPSGIHNVPFNPSGIHNVPFNPSGIHNVPFNPSGIRLFHLTLQVFIRSQRSQHLLTSMLLEVTPHVRSTVNSTLLVCEVLPFLSEIIAPSFRPVRMCL